MSDAPQAPGRALRQRPTRGFAAGVLLLLVLALAVRAPLVFYADDTIGLTDAFNLEEVENVRLSSGMLHKRTPHPHAFEYPSLFYYASAGVEAAARAMGQNEWRDYLRAVRGLSVAFGLATVLVLTLLGRRLGGPWAGLLAGSLYALDRTAIEISTLAKPNAAHVFFVVCGLYALVALAARPRLRTALAAAALFALAAGSKWIGGAGLLGIAPSAALALPAGERSGFARILHVLRAGLSVRVAFAAVLLPPIVFAAVFLLTTPGALLAPREFGYGFAHVFLAQSEHRRPLPPAISLVYLMRALGPIAAVLCAVGFAWTASRLWRWRGEEQGRGLAVLFGWTVAYGALVLFALARLPSYVDLWTPALAVLTGCAWVGPQGLLRSTLARAFALVAALAGGVAAHGDDALALVRREAYDSRPAAARWLAANAAPTDTVLADQGTWIPDSLEHVWWNGWGGPRRLVYDETVTWGRDPVWPAWPGGHRRLWFENAKWTHPESLLAVRPRWVVVSSSWRDRRREPLAAHEPMLESYDRALAGVSAGYVERVRFSPRHAADGSGWRTLARLGSAREGEISDGPEIVIYERRER
jgi:4-amino-4-deoxy-L-arabinose transferase-like glycosyltransferase